MELGYAMESMTDGWMGASGPWFLHASNPAVHVEAHPTGGKRISAAKGADQYMAGPVVFPGGCMADQQLDDSSLLSAFGWDVAISSVDHKLSDATLARTTPRRRTTTRGSSHLVAGLDRDAEADAALQATLVQMGGHHLWMNLMRAYSNVFAAQHSAEHVEAQCAAVQRWVLSAPQWVDRAASPDVDQFMTLYAHEVETYAAQLKATTAAAAAALDEADDTYARFMRNPIVAHAVASYDASPPPTAPPTSRRRAARFATTELRDASRDAEPADTDEEDEEDEEYEEEGEDEEEARRDGAKSGRRFKEAKAAVVVCTGTGMSEAEEAAHLQHLKSKYSLSLLKLKTQFMQRRKKGKLPTSAKAPLKAWWCNHILWPYPTEKDKKELAREAGLTPTQLSNWFINQRKRHWHKLFPGGPPDTQLKAREALKAKYGSTAAAIKAICAKVDLQ